MNLCEVSYPEVHHNHFFKGYNSLMKLDFIFLKKVSCILVSVDKDLLSKYIS